MATQTYYPPVGFHFKVEFDLDGVRDADFRFQEVSGLNVEIETTAKTAGGENRFSYALPNRAKYSNLILKRGLVTDSRLINWCQEAARSLEVEPITVWVTLLNDQHEPLQLYTFYNAWPMKWSISAFNAEESKLVMETLELSFHYFKID